MIDLEGAVMNVRMCAVFVIVAALILCACTTENEVGDEMGGVYQRITADEAKEMMVEGNLIVDVRTEKEYNEGHIEGALLVPLADIEAGKLELLPDKEQVLLVYCRSGNRSMTASEILIEEGYTNVYDFGGIIAWPYEIVK